MQFLRSLLDDIDTTLWITNHHVLLLVEATRKMNLCQMRLRPVAFITVHNLVRCAIELLLNQLVDLLGVGHWSDHSHRVLVLGSDSGGGKESSWLPSIVEISLIVVLEGVYCLSLAGLRERNVEGILSILQDGVILCNIHTDILSLFRLVTWRRRNVLFLLRNHS